jgi:hypothetical protein
MHLECAFHKLPVGVVNSNGIDSGIYILSLQGKPLLLFWPDPCGQASLVCVGGCVLDLDELLLMSKKFCFSIEDEDAEVFIVFVFGLRHVDVAVFPGSKRRSAFRHHHITKDAIEKAVWGGHGVSCSTGR